MMISSPSKERSLAKLTARGKIASNPLRNEEMLSQYYKLDGEVPVAVTNALAPRVALKAASMSDSINEDDNIYITALLDDPTISNKQREELAIEILRGDRDNSKRPKSAKRRGDGTSILLDDLKKLSMKVAQSRSSVRKPNFLEVSGRSGVQCLSPKRAIAEDKARLRDLGPRGVYTWAGQCLQEQVNFEGNISKTAARKDRGITKDLTINMSISKWKSDEKQRTRKELRGWREGVKLLQSLEKESLEKRMEFKKTLDDFRKKLHDRLKERKDPLTGSIMRCLDDSLTYYYLEKFNGYEMSADAILATIGSDIAGKDSTIAVDLASRIDLPESPRHAMHAHNALTTKMGGTQWNKQPASAKAKGSGFLIKQPLVGAVATALVPKSRLPSRNSLKGLPRIAQESASPDDEASPERAIEVLKAQMIRESTLPSIQPEPVLSEQQLEDLAAGRTTVEEIEARIRRQQRRLKQHNSEIPDITLPLSLSGVEKSLKDVLSISMDEMQFVKNAPLDVLEAYDLENGNFEGNSNVHGATVGIPTATSSDFGIAPVNSRWGVAGPAAPVGETEVKNAMNVAGVPPAVTARSQQSSSQSQAYSISHLTAGSSVRSNQSTAPMAAMSSSAGTRPMTDDIATTTEVKSFGSQSSRRDVRDVVESRPSLPQRVSPPRSIKTKDIIPSHGSTDPQNSTTPLPNSPYRSDREYFQVLNAGVPAGAGLSLWGSPMKKGRKGRFIAGSAPPLINPMIPTPYKGTAATIRPFF